MVIDMIAWRFESAGQQLWSKDDQQLSVEVDEYGIAEIPGDTLRALLLAAKWVRVDRDHAGPVT